MLTIALAGLGFSGSMFAQDLYRPGLSQRSFPTGMPALPVAPRPDRVPQAQRFALLLRRRLALRSRALAAR